MRNEDVDTTIGRFNRRKGDQMKKVFVWVCIFLMLGVGWRSRRRRKRGSPPRCGKKSGGACDHAEKRRHACLRTSGDSVGLDPAYETDGNSFMICDNILEALVFYKDESTTLEPGLATSWEISPDGLTYTFKLRKGVKFHDGTAFNADAVVFSIGRMMKTAMSNSPARGGTFPSRNARRNTGSRWDGRYSQLH